MIEWSECVVLGHWNSWTHSLKYQNGTVYEFAVYFKKWKRCKCKHLQCVHELVEQPQAALCQNRHHGGGVPLPFRGNECLGSCTMSWSRKRSLEVFLPSSVQNSFQPDHFLLPAPRARWVLETQRWTHLQQISLRDCIFTSAIKHKQPNFCRHSSKMSVLLTGGDTRGMLHSDLIDFFF